MTRLEQRLEEVKAMNKLMKEGCWEYVVDALGELLEERLYEMVCDEVAEMREKEPTLKEMRGE